MAEFVGGTLLDETRAYRKLLDLHARIPLLQAVGRTGDEAAQDARIVKLAAVTFKIRLLDALADLFRLHDPAVLAATLADATRRTRQDVPPTDRQKEAMRRAHARTVELERQIAFVHVAHLLLATDGLRQRDRELYPVEFEQLDAHFGRHYAQWAIAVAPAMDAFCRTPGRDQDIRLRAALDDFAFQLRKAAAGEVAHSFAAERAGGASRGTMPPAVPDVADLAVMGSAD